MGFFSFVSRRRKEKKGEKESLEDFVSKRGLEGEQRPEKDRQIFTDLTAYIWSCDKTP